MKNILFAASFLLFHAASAQETIIIQRGPGVPYAEVPGFASGSRLVSTKHGVFYSPTGLPPFQRSNRPEYQKPLTEYFANQHYLYDVLPSGRIITRGHTEPTAYTLYLTERGLVNPTPIGPVPKFKSSAPYDISMFQFLTETTGLLYQYNNMDVFKTQDQGRTWEYLSTLAPSVEPYRGYIRHFYMLTTQLGFAVVQVHELGEDQDAGANPFRESHLMRTTDGGRTWDRVRMPKNFTTQRILGTPYYMEVQGKLFLICYGDNQMYVSQDGGASFSGRTVPSMEQFGTHYTLKGKQMEIDDKTYSPFKLLFYNF